MAKTGKDEVIDNKEIQKVILEGEGKNLEEGKVNE